MSEPTTMPTPIERIGLTEDAIAVYPTGSGGTARVVWLPVPGPKAQTHCHVIVWTEDEVLTAPNIVRGSAGSPSKKLLAQL